MHYKNGREAKNGDKIVIVDGYAAGTAGFLVNAVAGNDYCNGQVAVPLPGVTPNLKECLHLDDVLAAVKAAEPPAEATG